ncbi:hypothetical protein [Methanothrix sp.]|jgi:H+/gluconate symporter-like permease|uniref:hypothetical protein n=1 Tax=Methanothrix sp. TaxID=90426 RepID=UPI00345E2DC8
MQVEIWKKVIDVQQHFNAIEMQIRNFAVTILAGILAAAGLALREPKNIKIFNFIVSSASAILIGGIIVLLAFYFMDRFWYHRLLQGAVTQGERLENEIKKTLPEAALSQTIRAGSPVLKIRSDRKIDIFYAIIILFLFVAAIGVNWGSESSDSTPSSNLIFALPFNISMTGTNPNNQYFNNSNGFFVDGILGIKYSNDKFDLEQIILNII